VLGFLEFQRLLFIPWVIEMKEMLRVAEAENQRKKEETENKDVLAANFPMQFYYSDCLINLTMKKQKEYIYTYQG